MRLNCLLRITTTIAVVTLTSCLSENSLVGPDPETGEGLVYQLAVVNSKNLPTVTSDGPPRVELLRGALTLSSDSTWIESLVFRVSDIGQAVIRTVTTRGRYSRSDAAITLRLQVDTTTQFTGTWTPTDVQLTDRTMAQGNQLVFRK